MKIKAISVITLLSFTLNTIFYPKVSECVGSVNKTGYEDLIPYNLGKITDSYRCGSNKLIIHIQDLHCNPEVQRNIAEIISILENRFNIESIFVEGASDVFDTNWVNIIEDEKIREWVIDSLFEQGKLTGIEYYCIKSNFKHKIYGLEDKNVYEDSIFRLCRIYEQEKEYKDILKNLEIKISSLERYFLNKRIKRFFSLIKSYNNSNPKRYYKLLYKYSKNIKKDLNNLPNLKSLIDIMNMEKKINLSKVMNEFKTLVRLLKDNLPYKEYVKLKDKTDNFQRFDIFINYVFESEAILDLIKNFNFISLERYFEYISLTKKINPLRLIEEERYLQREISYSFTIDDGEREILFLIEFINYLIDFCNTRITYYGYKYFNKNYKNFKKIYIKYFDTWQDIERLDSFVQLLNEYYKINIERNNCFINRILNSQYPFIHSNYEKDSNCEQEISNKGFNDINDISIVLTGGFHTQGLTELFKKIIFPIL